MPRKSERGGPNAEFLPQWRWHLDELFVRSNGEMYYLWRAVDNESEVLEAFVTTEVARQH